ncbi:hypothetical protein NEFER03_2064 [Nematocida sp. LUAm3]|nr:hypothetical protein NEFER03_2064 [Nematocida sp. LUAm3]KAI5179206.1 hypothetical protein NEFER01_2063 [Nematocida sp. LUAm1]
MKREPEEDSEEEVFERRRKVHKHESQAKDEIEELFAHSSESQEELSEEEEPWRIKGAAQAGILLEIFGDGTDYAYIVEAMEKEREKRQKIDQKEQNTEHKEEHFEVEEVLREATEIVKEKTAEIKEEAINEFLRDILEKQEAHERLNKLFYLLESPNELFTLFQAEQLLPSLVEKEKLFKRVPPQENEVLREITKYAKSLEEFKECSRAIRYVHLLSQKKISEQERKIALFVTKSLLNKETHEIFPNTEEVPSENNGLLGNPWLVKAAVEAGMDLFAKIRIRGSLPPQSPDDKTTNSSNSSDIVIEASKIFSTDILLLKSLKTHGITYSVEVDREKMKEHLVLKVCRDQNIPQVEQSISQFLQRNSEEIELGIELGLIKCAEDTVKHSLFTQIFSLASIEAHNLPLLSFWVTKGQVKYREVDAKENLISIGSPDQALLSGSRKEALYAITGKGKKLQALLKKKEMLFLPEDLLLPLALGNDLSTALSFFVKHPSISMEKIISSDQTLPHLVKYQELLRPAYIKETWKFLILCASSRKHLFSSQEYILLKKDLLEYIRSGGDIYLIDAEKETTLNALRGLVKRTPAPHTKYIPPTEEPILENKVLLHAYKECLEKLNSSNTLPNVIFSKRTHLLNISNLTEEILHLLETTWTLSSGVELKAPGKELEGVVVYAGAEASVQLSNGVYASLRGIHSLSVGERKVFKITDIDYNQQKIFAEEKKSSNTSMRAETHWQVKRISAKETMRLLKEKSFGAYILRTSSTYSSSLILTIRITDTFDECICSYIQIKEHPTGYEIERKKIDTIEDIISSFIPNFLRSIKRVISHKKFSLSPIDRIKRNLKEKQEKDAPSYAFTLAKKSGMVILLFLGKSDTPQEHILYPCEHGLIFDSQLFVRPEDLIQYISKTQLSK